MTRIYKVRPNRDFLEYFELRICSTKKEMNRHAEQWFKRGGHTLEHDGDTAGLVHPTPQREFPAEGKRQWFADGFATIFLNDESLRRHSCEIIAHECLHVAMAHERFVTHFNMDFGLAAENIEHDERLCYFHGRVVRGVYDALAKDRKLRNAR